LKERGESNEEKEREKATGKEGVKGKATHSVNSLYEETRAYQTSSVVEGSLAVKRIKRDHKKQERSGKENKSRSRECWIANIQCPGRCGPQKEREAERSGIP